MPQLIGSQLLHYRIDSHLGAGGMGEVYRATDTRLGRSVAIKVLPDLFALDPERVARFEREARLLASLNHANIAGLHGLEPADGKFFLVMELVEGETLAERIQRVPIPVEEALAYARQIAEALEAAHEKGVIHRDLKPANIKITPDGKIKVLDFGLAKAMEPVGRVLGPAGSQDPAYGVSHSPTLSLQATFAGVILGTAAYMAPEQAKGAATDQRSDIFAFGCVLYEMLTGRQAFQGDTATEILASVLKSEVDLTLLPPRLHPRLTELLRRCLEKDPKRRWHAAADVRMEIEAILADPRGLLVRSDASAQPLPLWKRALPFAATALVVAALSAVVAWSLRPAPPVASVTRFSIVLPDGQQLTRTGRHNIALSPDGQSLVYVANNQLYLRTMGDVEARPIEGTNQDINTPFFSPDGRWIAFYVVPEAKLKKIAVTGGASVIIGDATNPFGGSWGRDNQILLGAGEAGVKRISADGGTPETVVTVAPGEMAHGPQLLPDGDHVLFTLTKWTGSTRWDQAQVVVQSLRTGDRRVLINGGSDARYAPTGHLLYGLGANLLAAPFDASSLTVTGGPVPVLEDVARANFVNTAAMFYSFSANGALVYFSGETIVARNFQSLALVDRRGVVTPMGLPAAAYVDPQVSPDGRQLAVRLGGDGEDSSIWIYDLAGVLAPRRLTFDGATNMSPNWAPDGRTIVFISNRNEGRNAVFRQPADGSGSAERLTDPMVVQPTGSLHVSKAGTVVFRDGQGQGDLWMFALEGDRTPRPLVEGAGSQWNGTLSPDERWLAYTSNDSGRSQIYVQPFPQTGAKYQVTANGGFSPAWSPDGRRILFFEGEPNSVDGVIVSVDVRSEPGFASSPPTRVTPALALGNAPFTAMPDSRVMFLRAAQSAALGEKPRNHEIRVTLNWFEELKQRVSR